MKSRRARFRRERAIRFQACSRCAYTLVELLLVISLATIVLSTLGVLLHGAWQVERSMTDHRQYVDTLGRLAQQFRTDVHRASAVRVGATLNQTSGKSPSFIVELPNGEVNYSFRQSEIGRSLLQDSKVLAQETFQLPTGSVVRWEVSPPGGVSARQVASLLVSYPLVATARDLSGTRDLRVDAVIGISPAELSLAGGRR